jgi:hypothetical protein
MPRTFGPVQHAQGMGSYNRTMKRDRGDMIGAVDRAFDDDRPSSHPLIRNDAACAIPWVEDGFQAIEVFIDPALTDREAEICDALSALSADNRKMDGLNAAIHAYAQGAGLSAGVYERPPDDLANDSVAVVFTLG